MERPPYRPEQPSEPEVAAADAAGAAEAPRWDRSGLPDWLQPLASRLDDIRAEQLSRHLPGPEGGRRSAVLVLFGEGPDGPDVLMIRRADSLRKHAGQPAFPGGSIDPVDNGPVDAALREAQEETGLDPTGVQVIGVLPELLVVVSGFVVAPVIAWWREPCAVAVASPAEVAAVRRVPLAELVDPANRLRVRYPSSGVLGPAFRVPQLLIWGFTAGLLDRIIRVAGWERPWDHSRVEDLPPRPIPAQPAGGIVPPQSAAS